MMNFYKPLELDQNPDEDEDEAIFIGKLQKKPSKNRRHSDVEEVSSIPCDVC